MPRAVPSRPRVGRLFLGATLSLGVVVLLCAAAVGAYLSANGWVSHTLVVRDEVYSWLTSVIESQAGARAYMAGAGSVSIEPYQSALAKARDETARMRALIADNPAQVENVEIAARDADAVLGDLAEQISLARGGHWAEAVTAFDSTEKRKRREAFRLDTRRIHAEEDRLLGVRQSQAERRGWLALLSAIALASPSCLLLALAWRREQAHDRVLRALATDARARLRALSELAQALSGARTRGEVARIVVEHGARAAGADTCTLYELDETGKVLTLIGDRGVSPAVLDHIRTITETSGNPRALETLRSGVAAWAESAADYAKLYPEVANLKAEGQRVKALWSVPLVAEGRSLGLLGAGFYEARRFSDDERAFVETLVQHCAQALRRAARLERENEAQGLLATTLWSVGDAVIATDANGAVRFMNPVAQALTGWEENDARGRPLEEVFRIYSEETRAVVESPVAKVLREGTIVGLANHTVLRSKSGQEAPIHDSGAPIRGESGQIIGVVLVFRDATIERRERQRSEFLAKAGEALATSIDYGATLATVARFAVPTLADWCAVELVDPATGTHRQAAVAHVDESKVQFAKELGERYPPDRNTPTGVPQVIRSGRSELYTEIPKALLEAGARDPDHLRIIQDLQLNSAMIVPLKVRGAVLGALTFVYAESGRRYTGNDLAFAEDFARRAAMAIENARAVKDAEEARVKEGRLRADAELASRAKDEFLATVSHELRTPMNAILGWTTIARRHKLPDDVERALAIVERNARVQAKLIDDVLDTSRIVSGKLGLSLGPTNVSEVVSGVLETVAPAAEAKSIAMTSEALDPSLVIVADAERLQQIVWNLVSNAVKFTPKGGRVTVRAYREGSDVCICVSDTGEGIRRDVLPLVFERFHQADASITRRHGGLGIGLSIVKQLVAAHGGTVSAESEGEGKGATFTVHLPARSAVPAVRPASSTGSVPPVVPGIREAPRLDGLRLLVLDDEEDALDLVGEVLRGQGAEVHLASSARDALGRFGELRPDVIVSDIGMPEIDGFTFIRQIRALSPDRGGQTPAVALTAYVRSEDAQRAVAAGFQVHVAKPIEPVQLATIVAHLGGRTVEDA